VGKWIEKAGERRRRFYRLTGEGRQVLAAQRDNWREFVDAIRQITGPEHA
jgi:DNA-binding PadR family transcriptional regulator